MSNDNDFFGGIADFNGDGKTDLTEKYLFFKSVTGDHKIGSSSQQAKEHDSTEETVMFIALVIIVTFILLFIKLSINAEEESSQPVSKPSYSYSSRSYSEKPTYSRRNDNYAGSCRSSETREDDEYNAKDYLSAEDFYDDHYDDLYDFEDAEDYYDEYGD